MLAETDRTGALARKARSWLIETAAPLWSTRGRTAEGLFAERIALDGTPDEAAPRRVFVQARHVYAFIEAGRMGWDGPWDALTGQTIDLLMARARRADGFYVNSLTGTGDVHDARADLYVQAFMLFALGHAGAALGRPDLHDEAERLSALIDAQWGRANGGMREGEIADPALRRQNPHMHLLEAHMALHAASGRARFADGAEAMATLCHRHFIDAESGALREYFADDWSPAPGTDGTIAEPGHCFEWAWLFERMAAAGWAEGAALSDRLTGFARAHGIDPARGVAINAVTMNGAIHNGDARLWPQTERLKAAVARHARTGSPAEHDEIAAAAAGLDRYLDVDFPGLWRDKLRQDGRWIEEPAPGSSIYHIACAYGELHRISA